MRRLSFILAFLPSYALAGGCMNVSVSGEPAEFGEKVRCEATIACGTDTVVLEERWCSGGGDLGELLLDLIEIAQDVLEERCPNGNGRIIGDPACFKFTPAVLCLGPV